MKDTIDRRAAGAGAPVSEAGVARPPFEGDRHMTVGALEVLLRRLGEVESSMDALWPYGMACVNYEQWFALFRRRANLSIAIFNRRAA